MLQALFQGNSAPEGGGAIYAEGGMLHITESIFKGNTAEAYWGGAVSLSGGVLAEIVGCWFEENHCFYGGASVNLLRSSGSAHDLQISQGMVTAGGTAPPHAGWRRGLRREHLHHDRRRPG